MNVDFLVKCYHDLSKRMGIILKYEEKRCGYFSEQNTMMTSIHDDCYAANQDSKTQHAFEIILERSTLASNIRKMYNDLCTTGLFRFILIENVCI